VLVTERVEERVCVDLVQQVDGRSGELAVVTVLGHDACVALHDRSRRDVEVAKDLVRAPAPNELNGGVVHLSKKEGHGTAGP
jgi:hypothetical protein